MAAAAASLPTAWIAAPPVAGHIVPRPPSIIMPQVPRSQWVVHGSLSARPTAAVAPLRTQVTVPSFAVGSVQAPRQRPSAVYLSPLSSQRTIVATQVMMSPPLALRAREISQANVGWVKPVVSTAASQCPPVFLAPEVQSEPLRQRPVPLPEPPKPAARRPLVLHFDVNKTVIVCDPVKGMSMDTMLSSLLSEASWGTWDDSEPRPVDSEGRAKAASTWRLSQGPQTEAVEGLVTYAELLEDILGMTKEELRTLKAAFVSPGSPGESLHGVYEELQQKLTLPPGVVLPDPPPAVGPNRVFILPSFFHLLIHLEEQGRDFRVVFRTFGIDLPHVVKEFNCFCRGEHPLFPKVPAGLRRRVIELPRGTGEWYRDSAGPHLAMASGTGSKEFVQQAHGFKECSEALQLRLFGEGFVHSLALRDYFQHWRASKEADDSGKLLLVSHHEGPNTPLEVFFDDNIERERAHIVDARDAKTGEALPFASTKGVHLLKAEPFDAIRDPQYFIKALERAEVAYDKYHSGAT